MALGRLNLACLLIVFELLHSNSWGQGCPTDAADFADGGTFSGTCTISVTAGFTITGDVLLSSGTFNIINPSGTGNITIASGGSLTISNGATLNLTDDGRFFVNAGGVFNVDAGGSLYTSNTGDHEVYGTFNSAGIVDLNGDLVIIGGDVTISGGSFTINRDGGDGDIEMQGDGTLNILGGDVTVDDDILFVDPTTGTIYIAQGVTVDVANDVLLNSGNLIVDGSLIAGDDIIVGQPGQLSGTLVGGQIQFGGSYTADPDCPYSEGSIDFCTCLVSGCNSVLPITLSDFDGRQVKDAIELNWKTESEVNNEYFEVLRSTNGYDFEPLTRIQGAGTSNFPGYYSFTDLSPSARNYYKLKQVDFDGISTNSEVIRIEFTPYHELLIYPHPVTDDDFEIILPESGDILLSYSVTDLLGRNVKYETDLSKLQVNDRLRKLLSSLDEGCYILNVATEIRKYTTRLVKQ